MNLVTKIITTTFKFGIPIGVILWIAWIAFGKQIKKLLKARQPQTPKDKLTEKKEELEIAKVQSEIYKLKEGGDNDGENN